MYLVLCFSCSVGFNFSGIVQMMAFFAGRRHSHGHIEAGMHGYKVHLRLLSVASRLLQNHEIAHTLLGVAVPYTQSLIQKAIGAGINEYCESFIPNYPKEISFQGHATPWLARFVLKMASQTGEFCQQP